MPPEMQQAVQQFNVAIQQKDQMLQQAGQQIQQMTAEMEKLKIDKQKADLRTQEFEVDGAREMLQKDYELIQEKMRNQEILQETRVKEFLAETARIKVEEDAAIKRQSLELDEDIAIADHHSAHMDRMMQNSQESQRQAD
jgi:hypothetical protein